MENGYNEQVVALKQRVARAELPMGRRRLAQGLLWWRRSSSVVVVTGAVLLGRLLVGRGLFDLTGFGVALAVVIVVRLLTGLVERRVVARLLGEGA